MGKKIKRGGIICALGSCFAIEIRTLLSKDYDVRPREGRSYGLVWYNTYSIRYEFDRVYNGFKTNFDDCWENKSSRPGWQEPSRRIVVAPTMAELRKMSAALDREISYAIKPADIFVITLGMSETWRLKSSGLVACAHPQYGHRGRSGGVRACEFHNASTADNYKNLSHICKLIAEHKPGVQVVFTVSPVPLNKTFTKMPLGRANAISKRKLRDAAIQVVSKYGFAHYFDSYEYCKSLPKRKCYQPDGRHVRPEVVKRVVRRFRERFCE